MTNQHANISKAIAQAAEEVTRLVVQDMAVVRAENSTRQEGRQNSKPKIGRPMMKQPIFN